MKFVKILLLVIILVSACTHDEEKDQKSWPVDFNALVNLNCKAIELRKARFATADSMRLEMDSIKNAMDSATFHQYRIDFERRKDALLSESNILADSIRLRMKNVMRDLDPDQKRAFNDSIQKVLKSRGCE